jgi:ATP-dependent Lon protease
MNKQQRDFFLREQLKLIKNELGISKEGKEADIDLFTKRLKKLTLTKEAKEKYKDELSKFKIIEQHSPEFNVSRNYLDWLTSIPWGVHSKDNLNLPKAEAILNEDHYGLEDVKERILEFLAVGINKGEISGTILCLVGPPGVGKTSLGQSIARSLNRKFYRFSLGGARDEAEIKGHRRTYIGSMPGKFIQALKTCKTANPVIMLDEIDKISKSYNGDPASALLEVLDPEQNADFLDHYLDVRFDLSNVFFICTANQLDTIPRPLLDRMELIELAGYIQEEKVEIAKKYLIPKALDGAGLKKSKFGITTPALNNIISGYAREPGVRTLDKQIKKTCRKAAKRFILEKNLKKLSVTKKNLTKFLGEPRFSDSALYKEAIPGVVMGLAWTSLGGVTLYIEANSIHTGKASFKQTGQLGNVMIESSLIAYSYIQSSADKNKKLNEFFENNAIHLHVPAGATPKDGPSAGITMALALYSLATGNAVKKNIAMTGELSLTGRVLPIGGIKEKTIAAKRANVSVIIMPKENEKDYMEIPEYIRDGLKAHFVSHFEEVIKIAGL